MNLSNKKFSWGIVHSAITMAALTIWLPLAIIVHIFMGGLRRLKWMATRSRPDTEDGMEHHQTVPILNSFVGDIFGYFNYFNRGWSGVFVPMIGSHGTVTATNIGTPVVACLDSVSAGALFDKIDNKLHAHQIVLKSTRAAKPLFITSGLEATNARAFVKALLPENLKDPKFEFAQLALKSELSTWAALSTTEIARLDISKAVGDMILTYASALFLGEAADKKLVAQVFPVPNYMPKYPYIPRYLIPTYRRMHCALAQISGEMRQAPYWKEIELLARTNDLSDQQACDTIFTAMTFNALGLSNSMLNAIALLSALPHKGVELMEDSDLLDSFAWELLRHNGVSVLFRTDNITDISTSSGKQYQVLANTMLFTNTALAQRDECNWKEAHLFKMDRFNPLPNSDLHRRDIRTGDEPLPTLSFGCPLGRSNDKNPEENSHQCPFMPYAQPMLKHYIQLLVEDFTWGLDRKSEAVIQRVRNDQLQFDLSFKNLNGGAKPTEDMVIHVDDGMRFSNFSQRQP